MYFLMLEFETTSSKNWHLQINGKLTKLQVIKKVLQRNVLFDDPATFA